jgi:hypothetical protein
LKRKYFVGGGAFGTIVVAFAGMLSAHSLCGCSSLEAKMQSLGASPMSDPVEFRTKLLDFIPPGSSTHEMFYSLGALALGHGIRNPKDMATDSWRSEFSDRTERRCTSRESRMSCRFLLETQWWGYNHRGFDIHFEVDQKQRIKDLTVAPFSAWSL